MKKEFTICFEAIGLAGMKNIHPISAPSYKSEAEAEEQLKKLIQHPESEMTRRFFILPTYTKA